MENYFSVEVAKIHGVAQAVVIHYFMSQFPERQIEIDGKIWVFHTNEELYLRFPYWVKRKVKKTINNLIKKQILLTKEINNATAYFIDCDLLLTVN